MTSLSGIARPYALAAFEYAREKKLLSPWKQFLETAALLSQDSSMEPLLANPKISGTQLFDLYCHILTSLLDTEKKNFLSLLAQNRRFAILPQMSELYNTYYAALEKMSAVRVITAVETQEDYQQKLAQALAKRLECQVTLQCDTDPAILGGTIIHIGDRVIDDSIRGKLTRLLENLTG